MTKIEQKVAHFKALCHSFGLIDKQIETLSKKALRFYFQGQADQRLGKQQKTEQPFNMVDYTNEILINSIPNNHE